MKKLSEQYVIDYFIENGCMLLDQYEEYHKPMKYRCVCGNISMINFANFKNGRRCAECKKNKISNRLKRDIDYVKSCFTNGGCELLETKYINNHTLMKYRCQCGSISKIRFSNFQSGNRCGDCKINKMSGCNHPLWKQDREALRIEQLFRKKCYKAIQSVLEKTCQSKFYKTRVILGYSMKQLQDHIQGHVNWEQCKNSNWHLDHIFPIDAFLDYKISDIRLINCLDNLQPLLAEDNISKSNHYDKNEFINWLQKHNLFLEAT